jgi:hypothetical protein
MQPTSQECSRRWGLVGIPVRSGYQSRYRLNFFPESHAPGYLVSDLILRTRKETTVVPSVFSVAGD